MTRRDRDFGEFVRRSLHAAAEPVMIGQDGPARIHARLAAVRQADAADPGEHYGLAARAGQSCRARAEPVQSACKRPVVSTQKGGERSVRSIPSDPGPGLPRGTASGRRDRCHPGALDPVPRRARSALGAWRAADPASVSTRLALAPLEPSAPVPSDASPGYRSRDRS